MNNISIQGLMLGPGFTNCYVISDRESGKAVVIDPAYPSIHIIKTAEKNNCMIDKIILTHGHYDHTGGINWLKEQLDDVKVYSHKNGIEVLGDPNLNLTGKIGRIKEVHTPDFTVEDGDVIEVSDNCKFEIIHTPGHTVDSMCLKLGGALFCGDTIFRKSVGRGDLPTGDANQELESIKTKILTLDDDTVLFPGHGETTSVGVEKRENPYLK